MQKIITSEFSFDSAHFLSGHDGKCRNLHGHRWRCIVTITGDQQREGSSKGMIVDFTDFKNQLKFVEGLLDHKLIIERGSLPESLIIAMQEQGFELVFTQFRTTAENMSEWIYNLLSGVFNVVEVTLYETPNNSVTYRRDR